MFLVSFLVYFSYHHWIAASAGPSLTTKKHQHPSPILLESCHSFSPLCKNHKKPEFDKKIQTYKAVTLTESFVFSSCRCSKQSVSCLLTLNLSEHFIRWGCFQICSGNKNTLLLKSLI